MSAPKVKKETVARVKTGEVSTKVVKKEPRTASAKKQTSV